MVDVAQLVRVPDCGSEGRGFESLLPPTKKEARPLFLYLYYSKSVLYATDRHRSSIVVVVTIYSKAVYTNATKIRKAFTIFG